MALNDSIAAAVKKKTQLLETSPSRFAVRAILAGAYLTLGTAFAGVVGNAVDKHVPGLGAPVFALLFGIGLFAIVILGAELATSNMMYMVYGVAQRRVGWGKGLWLLAVSTVFNLVGAALVALALGYSAKMGHMDPSHLLATIVEGKLNKSAGGLLIEALLANFVVNMAIVGALFAKDLGSKFLVIVPIIAIFVGLSLEHVVANFCLMLLVLFASDPLPAAMTLGAVAENWVMVWLGNLIGGGVLMGGVYAWLNQGPGEYRD
ncbi:formate/nitrite transporter family protein [Corynebacterium flavescens]|uniref:formate/nitrite transporter family protein n=1 Tax=Corynebacterium flavescens TaxID=28028 RepID=UPI0028984495|nr:formate/nitrite transporter family protein [Corynebacterium flavescens]